MQPFAGHVYRLNVQASSCFVRAALVPVAAVLVPAAGHHHGLQHLLDGARPDAAQRRPTARARVVLQPRLARAAQEMSLGALEYVAAMPVHAHGAVRQVFADRAGQFSELALFVGASRDPSRLGSGLGRIVVAVRQRTEYVRQHTAASASGSLSGQPLKLRKGLDSRNSGRV